MTFSDSLREDTEVRLAEDNLPQSSVFELEYDIINYPVFVHNATFDSIEPAEEGKILLQCNGKVGW